MGAQERGSEWHPCVLWPGCPLPLPSWPPPGGRLGLSLETICFLSYQDSPLSLGFSGMFLLPLRHIYYYFKITLWCISP